ncbi:MAG TPA: hypothetical protein DCQ04_09755 [Actinobacteria bacterium]|nr:hypothetical protein [Actinomycetota bacterium]
MTLRNRVRWIATVGVLILVGAAVLALGSFLRAQASGDEIIDKLEPAATSASTLLLSTADMERGVSSYVTTGRAGSLAPYAEGSTVSEDAISELQSLLESTDSALEQQVQSVDDARDAWINTVANPTIALVRGNDQAGAEKLLNSDKSNRTFEILRARATALNTLIDARLSAQFNEFGAVANQLWKVLLGSWLVLLVAAVGVIVALHRWVLRPLELLRDQINRVAGDEGYGGDRDVEIIPTGPPELSEVGADAEAMRRRLVHEIETVDRQRESLENEGPVVTAIRAELTRDSVVFAPGLTIYGDLEPSESELAGDWWDAVALPDGRTALLITDISGHGPDAGIAGLRLKLAVTGMLEAGSDATTAFERGVRLFEETPGRFATAAAVLINPTTYEVEWVNAGHLPPMIISPDGSYRELEMTGPLMSTLGGAWQSKTTQVDPRDIVVLWTDGVTESRDAAGEELEESGLRSLIAEARASGDVAPKQIVGKVLAASRSRAINWGNDDRTLIISAFGGQPN